VKVAEENVSTSPYPRLSMSAEAKMLQQPSWSFDVTAWC